MGYPDATLDASRTFDFDQSTQGEVFLFLFVSFSEALEFGQIYSLA